MLETYIQNFSDNDTVAFARTMLNFHPDPIQAQVLDPNIRRGILNCCRQWGKSTILAIKAVHHAYTHPDSLTLCVSPSARQSAIFLRKCRTFLRRLGLKTPTDGDNRISALLPNGARIVGIPGREDTTRGFSAVSLLLVDEASRVSEEIFTAVMPMLAAAPDASFWLLSTPSGCDNFFFHVWTNLETYHQWTRIHVDAPACPRISAVFLAEQRRTMAPSTFNQEYLCQFVTADDAIYNIDHLKGLLEDFPLLLPYRLNAPGLPRKHSLSSALTFPDGRQARSLRILEQHFFLGLDIGRSRDFSVLSILERTYVQSDLRNLVTYQYLTADLHRLVHLERFPLGVEYSDVARQLDHILSLDPFSLGATLAFDATGAGAPFADLLKHYVRIPRRHLFPVVITSGFTATRHPDAYHVPRHQLLGNLENLAKQQTLRVSQSLPLALPFFRELAQLRVKSSPAGRPTIQPARSTQHDDMVFSVALAAFASSCHKGPHARSHFKPTIAPTIAPCLRPRPIPPEPEEPNRPAPPAR